MQGLRTGRIRSQVVLDTVLAVMSLNRPVQFVWVKAHSGIGDNEAVDELAKQAIDCEDVLDTLIPNSEIKAVVLDALRAE